MTTFSETFSMAYSREPYAIALSATYDITVAVEPLSRSEIRSCEDRYVR